MLSQEASETRSEHKSAFEGQQKQLDSHSQQLHDYGKQYQALEKRVRIMHGKDTNTASRVSHIAGEVAKSQSTIRKLQEQSQGDISVNRQQSDEAKKMAQQAEKATRCKV